jgi:hypothetical protein
MAKPASPTWTSGGVGGANCIGYWLLSEGTGAPQDLSGNWPGTEALGDATWGTGTSYDPVLATGPSAAADLGADSTSRSALTLATLVRVDETLPNYAGFLFSRGAVATGMYAVGGELTYCWNGDSNTYDWAGGPAIPLDEWCVLILSVNATTVTAYAVTAGGSTSGNQSYSHAATSLGGLWLGMDSNNPTGRAVTGVFGAAAVWSVAFDGTQAAALAADWLGGTFSAAGGGARIIAPISLYYSRLRARA